MSFSCLNPLVAFHVLSVVKLQGFFMWLWIRVSLISACLTSCYSPSYVFISVAASWNFSGFRPSCDELTLRPNLLNPTCPLGSFMKLSSSLWADIVPVLTHQTFITTVCCRELDLNLSLLSESTFHRSQNMRERYLTRYTKIPLLTAWSQVPLGYLLNEGLLKLIGNILRSVGFSDDYLHLCCLCKVTKYRGIPPCLSGTQVHLLPKNCSDVKPSIWNIFLRAEPSHPGSFPLMKSDDWCIAFLVGQMAEEHF